MATQEHVQRLHEINGRLRAAVLLFRPEQKRPAAIQQKDFDVIRAEILRARDCMHSASDDQEYNVAFALELSLYRACLKELRRALPALQVQLLAERSRIETARTHLVSAAAWAGAHRKTL